MLQKICNNCKHCEYDRIGNYRWCKIFKMNVNKYGDGERCSRYETKKEFEVIGWKEI